jgi:hypothetical protein
MLIACVLTATGPMLRSTVGKDGGVCAVLPPMTSAAAHTMPGETRVRKNCRMRRMGDPVQLVVATGLEITACNTTWVSVRRP